MDFVTSISIGLAAATTATNLLYCLIGVTLGTALGVLPGIGALAAVSMLFPITFHLEPLTALVMLGGIYYGTAYGGSTAAILLNIPGTPSSSVTCIDGYPMAKQGRAGIALFMTTIASLAGGSIGILVMMALSPTIAKFSLGFGPAEFTSLMLLALFAASTISDGSMIKALAMVAFGILLGTVGTDIYTGAHRFTFGMPELMDGVSIVALAMGIFGIVEVISSIGVGETRGKTERVTWKSMLPTRDDWRRSYMPMLRGSGIGSFFGILPGTGGTVASFISYAVEKRTAKEPSRFGQGAIEGISGPESANNAADQTAFIPTLTLGVPGSATMALMLGALLIHGITPGPMMIAEHPDIFWGVIMSFWIGNVMLLILNLPLINVWVMMLRVPYRYLYPAVLVFICIGVYSIHNSPFEVVTVVVFGILGYGMKLLGFPAPSLLLGFVLGPMIEEQFRRAMVISRGDPVIFVDRPLSLIFLLITVALMALVMVRFLRDRPTRSNPLEE